MLSPRSVWCCPSFSLFAFSFVLPLQIWMKASPMATMALHELESTVIFRLHSSLLLMIYSYIFFAFVLFFSILLGCYTAHRVTCKSLSTNHLLHAAFSHSWYKLVVVSTFAFFFESLCAQCLHSPFERIICFQKAQTRFNSWFNYQHSSENEKKVLKNTVKNALLTNQSRESKQ